MERTTKETRVSFSFPITKEGQLLTVDTLELPKHTTFVKGVQLLSDHPDRLYYRGSQRIEIGGQEIFPEGFDSKILMSSLSVPPRERFFDLGQVLPGDLLVKIRYKDTLHPNAAFEQGYTVRILLLLEEKV